MNRILKCAMITIGTLIGAGFASGQEISTFFNRFSEEGILGIIFSSILFGSIIFVILNISNKTNILDYQSLVKHNKLFIALIKVFTFICFCIMIAGIGTYVNEQYKMNFWIGTISAGLICFAFFCFQLKGLEKINDYFVPIIIAGIVILCFTSKANFDVIIFENTIFHQFGLVKNWFQSMVLYFGYNSILLVPILIEMRSYHLNKKEITVLSIFTAQLLCLTGLLIYFTLNQYYPDILYTEMPALLIAKISGQRIFHYYSAVIIFAIFTTAFSSGYAFLKLNSEKYYFKNSLLICIFGVIFARIGFSNLVNLFFPIFGYFGVLQIIYILILNKKL